MYDTVLTHKSQLSYKPAIAHNKQSSQENLLKLKLCTIFFSANELKIPVFGVIQI